MNSRSRGPSSFFFLFLITAAGAAGAACAAEEEHRAGAEDATQPPIAQPSPDASRAVAPNAADDASNNASDASDATTSDALAVPADAAAVCPQPAPGLYRVTMVRVSGQGVACFDYHETTINLTPEGIADAAAQPPPAPPPGVADAGTCTLVASTPCTSKATCLVDGTTFTSTFEETRNPATGSGTTHWAALYPDGGVLWDCTWSVTWTKL